MMSLAPEALRDEPLPPMPGFDALHPPRAGRRGAGHQRVELSAAIAVNVVVPAVLAGNAVIVKHAQPHARSAATPSPALSAPRARRKAWSPPSTATHETCARIIARPEVGYVSFTGSVRGGHEVYRRRREALHRRRARAGRQGPGLRAPGRRSRERGRERRRRRVLQRRAELLRHRARLRARVGLRPLRRGRAGRACAGTGWAIRWRAETTMGPMAQPRRRRSWRRRSTRRGRRAGACSAVAGRCTTPRARGRFFDPALVVDATHAMTG